MKSITVTHFFFLLVLGISAQVSATPLTLTSGLNLNRNANLVTNGSFEGHPTNATTLYYWATGTTMTAFPFLTPTGWISSGGPLNYADWGNTSFFHNAAPVPDGVASLYFGNQFVSSVSSTPSFNLDGTVVFGSTPTIVPGTDQAPPVTVSQTITVTPGALYGLSFWVSGENANFPGNPLKHDGIFALDVTGYSTVYLAVPYGGSNLGASDVYEFSFVPSTSSITLTFTNWGHFGSVITPTTGWTLPDTTELILDDVILNALNTVPEPSTMLLLSVGLVGLLGYGWRKKPTE